MAGTWTAYSVGQQANDALNWTDCTLVINAKGAFSTAASACVNSSNVAAKVQGQIKLGAPAKCLFSGSITAPSLGTSAYVRSLTLSPDKGNASGIGGGGQYGHAFVFNMVRQK